jgi:hypothetical protein
MIPARIVKWMDSHWEGKMKPIPCPIYFAIRKFLRDIDHNWYVR